MNEISMTPVDRIYLDLVEIQSSLQRIDPDWNSQDFHDLREEKEKEFDEVRKRIMEEKLKGKIGFSQQPSAGKSWESTIDYNVDLIKANISQYDTILYKNEETNARTYLHKKREESNSKEEKKEELKVEERMDSSDNQEVVLYRDVLKIIFSMLPRTNQVHLVCKNWYNVKKEMLPPKTILGVPPLLYSAARDQSESVRYLLSYPHIRNRDYVIDAVVAAGRYGCVNTLKEFLKYHPKEVNLQSALYRLLNPQETQSKETFSLVWSVDSWDWERLRIDCGNNRAKIASSLPLDNTDLIKRLIRNPDLRWLFEIEVAASSLQLFSMIVGEKHKDWTQEDWDFVEEKVEFSAHQDVKSWMTKNRPVIGLWDKLFKKKKKKRAYPASDAMKQLWDEVESWTYNR
eukprot:TRINITY_DN2395_c0_g1_i1.p1 TRINITY_DN2395_c0_g1~~TRINITY_DN2395_c0_g1_i1.p1  ORF type:complete len:408 (+),score=123.26 TRINITY_DN2395_c0_g1_i1:23-1225(+)